MLRYVRISGFTLAERLTGRSADAVEPPFAPPLKGGGADCAAKGTLYWAAMAVP
jgi:hypothetical protein